MIIEWVKVHHPEMCECVIYVCCVGGFSSLGVVAINFLIVSGILVCSSFLIIVY